MNTRLAGCIIRDQAEHILMMHRNTSDWQHWEVPGGKVEDEEDTETAAVREVKEELGIDVVVIKKLGQCVFRQADKDYDYTWYQAEIVAGKPKLLEPQTFDEIRYLSLEEMHSEPLSTGAQTFLSLMDGPEFTA